MLIIDNIIWDFDGTLFDSYKVMTEALYLSLKEVNVEEDKSNIYINLKNSLGYAVDYYINKYKLNIEKIELIEKFHSFENKLYLNEIKPMDFALNLCKKITLAGGQNFLVTHRSGNISEILMNKYGFSSYFTECITQDYNFLRKPSGEAFKYIVNKYRLNPKETLGIGDRTIDIIAAAESGIKTCFISDGIVNCEVKADYHVESLEEIMDLFN